MASNFGRPKCPNHKVQLILTDTPGIGICPISDFRFEYDDQQAEKERKLKINALGQLVSEDTWRVKQIGGKGG